MVGMLVLTQTEEADACHYCRLNTKIQARELEVKDLVADLSDGVSAHSRDSPEHP